MHKIKLKNGLKVIFEKKPGKSVVVQVMVKAGSNQESKEDRGMSHFLEHMLFEGTKKRPDNRTLSNEIEKIGGEFNAYTTNERTCFYIKVLNKHFKKAVEILSDIFQNSLFKEEHLTKEKKIVIKEIDLVNDEPSFYQWILFQKTLFKKHPCRFPTYGNKSAVNKFNRERTIDYFNKHYVPKNMVVSVVGNLKDWKSVIKKYFSFEGTIPKKSKSSSEPFDKKSTIKKEKIKTTNTYTILGFKTVPRNHNDSYIIEVINAILGRGQSGRVFNEIRSKLGLAYDVGTQHISELSFGYFAVYATIDKKNINKVKSLILKEFDKLQKIDLKDINEAKDYIEGNFSLELEDTQKVADQLLLWEQVKDARLMKDYIKQIKKVTVNDVKRVVKKYFKNYTMVMLEGK